MNKTILGLDLGTNSIGWALIDKSDKKILGMGSRVIPMGAELSKFEQGQAQTKNAVRRTSRGARRLNKRYKQRRNKLIYVLQQLGMLPSQIKLESEFTNPNKIDKVCILPIEKNKKQYTALDLINLRVKALNEKVSLEELGKIIYLYNQLRGYSGGGAEPDKDVLDEEESGEEKKAKRENIITLCKILEINPAEEIIFKGKKINKRKLKLEIDNENFDETIIDADTFLELLKVNDIVELQINKSITKSGINYFIKLPNKTNWRKQMENIEKELSDKCQEYGRTYFIAEHFLEILKQNPYAKLRDNVILRNRYVVEFEKIWDTQYKKNDEFKNLVDNKELLKTIVNYIFPDRDSSKSLTSQTIISKKEKFRKEALDLGLEHLIKNQIIYYQRELADQSNLISDCRYEANEKAVSKSHPTFQEFRIWEQINKISINTKIDSGRRTKKGEIKYEYIDKPIDVNLKEWIYDELKTKKEITGKAIFVKLLKDFGFVKGEQFLNGIDEKSKIKCNETTYTLKKNLKDYWNLLQLDNEQNLIFLWDLLYNKKGNEYDLLSDRTSSILDYLKSIMGASENIDSLAIQISKIKFVRNYSSLSLKAINNIMPLVKAGKYFENNFSKELHEKIVKLHNEHVSDPFEKAAQTYLENNIELLSHGGIVNAYATMLVYNQHTTKALQDNELINSFHQIKRLKQGELRNPLAEQIINETLVIVKDIWKQFGEKPSEIRIELARELKNSADRRKKMHKSNIDNQKVNQEVKNRLNELNEELTLANIEKYKLWSMQNNTDEKYLKKYTDPSKSQEEKYKLWMEQGHVSPYTGKPIPLSELFNKARYDVDHIIPQSRYFDDSSGNKVVCEKVINKDKGNRTAMEYLEAGSIIVQLRSKEEYAVEVNKTFNGIKRKNLLAIKVPEDPIQRQIKDTQYIAVRTKEELYKIVGNDNVKSSTGGVTDYLRNQWGLTDKFKTILQPRYQNILENTKVLDIEFDKYEKEHKKNKNEYEENEKVYDRIILNKNEFIEQYKQNAIFYKKNKLILKDWSKRIDHRHHAVDALVVACTEPAHIKRLNDLNQELQDWLDKNRNELLPNFEGSPSELIEEMMSLPENKREFITKQLKKFRLIEMPWSGFDFDAEKEIKKIIVSQKPKDKLIIQRDKNSNQLQIKIRSELHEGTNYGKAGSGINKIKNAETIRVSLTKFSQDKFATEKAIPKIVNDDLRNTISIHFDRFKKNKKEAFSAEGIAELNATIEAKKNKKGNSHKPIFKIKLFYKNPLEKYSLSKLGTKKITSQDFNKIIERIPDEKLKENLISHVDSMLTLTNAFSKEGIRKLNETLLLEFKSIASNEDKKYIPINSIKLIALENEDSNEEANESLTRLQRPKSFNNALYVRTGGNYLFAIMEKEVFDKKEKINKLVRCFDLINLFDATNLLKEFFNAIEDKSKFNKNEFFKNYFETKNESKLLFTLKLGDYVYLPNENHIVDTSNIYIVQKFSGNQIYFINHNIAKSIKPKLEFGSQDCIEKIGDISIKDKCIKLNVDRLGNIIL